MKKILIFTAVIISLPVLSAEAPPVTPDFDAFEGIKIANPETVLFLRQKHQRLIEARNRDFNKITKDRERISLREMIARAQALEKTEALLVSLTNALNAVYGGTPDHPMFPADLLALLLSKEDIDHIKKEETEAIFTRMFSRLHLQ